MKPGKKQAKGLTDTSGSSRPAGPSQREIEKLMARCVDAGLDPEKSWDKLPTQAKVLWMKHKETIATYCYFVGSDERETQDILKDGISFPV